MNIINDISKLNTLRANTGNPACVMDSSALSSENISLLLNSIVDKIGIEDVKASLTGIIEREEEMKRRKEILENHEKHNRITFAASKGLYRTKIDGKDTYGKSREILEEKIIAFYSNSDDDISGIYPAFIEWRREQVSANTVKIDQRTYETYIKGSNIDGKPIKNITVKDAYDFMNHCKSIKPDMTKSYWKNQILNTIKMLFTYIKSVQIRFDNPFDDIVITGKHYFAEPIKKPDSDQIFTKKEAENVKRLAHEEGFNKSNTRALGIEFDFETGMRVGELCGAKWKDIEQDGEYIHICRQVVEDTDENGKSAGHRVVEYTKSQAGNRLIKLSTNAKAILEETKKVNQLKGYPVNPDDFIFIRKKKGEYTFCTQRSFYNKLQKYCENSGMSVVKSMHDIRRTVITRMYHNIINSKDSDANLKKLQVFAGHSTLQQTLDYVKADKDDLSLPMDILENLYT